jgi:4-hydroxy-tetrahydrodipicolinate reductase
VKLAEVAAEALARDPARDLRFSRHGMIGERPPREIGVQTPGAATWSGAHGLLGAGSG